MDHSRLLLLLACNLPLQQWATWFPLSAIHNLNVQFQYTCIAVSELLTKLLWEITLATRVQYFCMVSFAFSCTHSTYFKTHLSEHIFPHSFQLLFNTLEVLLFCHILRSILRSLNFFFIYMHWSLFLVL